VKDQLKVRENLLMKFLKKKRINSIFFSKKKNFYGIDDLKFSSFKHESAAETRIASPSLFILFTSIE